MTVKFSDSKSRPAHAYAPLPCDPNYVSHNLFATFRFEKLLLLSLRTAGLILLYYSFSIGITFFQKSLIQDFQYPLTVVTCHLFVKYFLAAIIRLWYRVATGTARITVAWSSNWRKLAATGIASALDIGFSNWSFEFITVSLYVMTKSSCVVFILMFAILFKLEKKRLSLVVIVCLISLGLFMFTFQSTQFRWEGFVLALSASFIGGLRWTMAQLIMQRKDIGLSHPIDMIYYIQPWMIFALFPLSLWLEMLPHLQQQSIYEIMDHEGAWEKAAYILIGSVFAFFLELSEYLLLTYTSSLTLSIAGIFKEIFTLFLAYEYSGDQMSTINFCGLMFCLFGIAYHVYQKAVDMSKADATNERYDDRDSILNEDDEEAY